MAETLFPLNTGAKIPALGFGTWQAKPGEVEKAVEYALSIGYRHIDTAYSYSNEEEVGLGIKRAIEASNGALKRSNIFVTTKLWSTHHRQVRENLDLSLAKLGLEYVDLYLMHWPVALNPSGNHSLFPVRADGSRDVDPTRYHVDTYLEMEMLLSTGKVKAIGVANYSIKYLEELLKFATVTPAVNQVECHPLLPQTDVGVFCTERGIHVTAYSPLGSTGSPLLGLPVVERIAEKHGVSPASVLLSYHVERGHSVLSKSVTSSRIKANRQITHLDENDMKDLAELSSNGQLKRYVDPQWNVNLGFPDKQQ